MMRVFLVMLLFIAGIGVGLVAFKLSDRSKPDLPRGFVERECVREP